MLKGISPLLNADVLYAIRAMGHGDDLIIADTNFPADSIARQTRLGKLLRIDNVTAAEAVNAILSLYPWTPSSTTRPGAWRSSASRRSCLRCRRKCRR